MTNDGLDGYVAPPPGAEPAGAPTQEAPPASGEPAPQQPATPPHEPPPGSERFNEVYRNWKTAERKIEELTSQVGAQLAAPPQPQTPQQESYEPADDRATVQGEDGWGELRNVIGDAVATRIAPLEEQFQQQKQESLAQQNYQTFQGQNPEFKLAEDGPRVMQVVNGYRQRGVEIPLDAAYTMAFPDRAAAKLAPPQAPEAPVANVGGVTIQPPAGDPQAIWDAMTAEQVPSRREALYQQFMAAGGGGVQEAEARLGW